MKYEYKVVYRGTSQDITPTEMERFYNEGHWEFVSMGGPTVLGLHYWFRREKKIYTECTQVEYEEQSEYE